MKITIQNIEKFASFIHKASPLSTTIGLVIDLSKQRLVVKSYNYIESALKYISMDYTKILTIDEADDITGLSDRVIVPLLNTVFFMKILSFYQNGMELILSLDKNTETLSEYEYYVCNQYQLRKPGLLYIGSVCSTADIPMYHDDNITDFIDVNTNEPSTYLQIPTSTYFYCKNLSVLNTKTDTLVMKEDKGRVICKGENWDYEVIPKETMVENNYRFDIPSIEIPTRYIGCITDATDSYNMLKVQNLVIWYENDTMFDLLALVQ